MTLQKWNPYYGFDRFFDDVNHVVGRSVLNPARKAQNCGCNFAVDIREDDKELRLTAELPGISADDLDIRVEDNVLHINGERQFQDEDNRENYHRLERYYGKFERSFTLPTYVNSGKISAEHKDGILTLHIPKKPETQPRQIKVKTGE
ncbi:MAG: Hsp20/alpha crystallin family protein [Deltaproteobacteria bacterium]|nr:Hsp20/alpha crystallin family protein [Deltaproteobacteria bacterium]